MRRSVSCFASASRRKDWWAANRSAFESPDEGGAGFSFSYPARKSVCALLAKDAKSKIIIEQKRKVNKD